MVREIPLTQGFVALIDDDDYAAVSSLRWHARPTPWAVYAERNPTQEVPARSIHRFILSAPKESLVDHRNGNGLDCRRCNLRLASAAQNSRNRRLDRRNASGFVGVTWHSRFQTWRAQITVNRRTLHLSYFTDPVEGAKAYDEAARRHFGDFAVFNFPFDGERAV